MKKYLISAAVLVLIGVFFSMNNIYTSSPGFVRQEDAKEFYENKPTCTGISILLNKKQTWVDAPGRSLCIGILKK